jgi:hypothetical protein
VDIVATASHRGKDLLWMLLHTTNKFRVVYVFVCVCARGARKVRNINVELRRARVKKKNAKHVDTRTII